MSPRPGRKEPSTAVRPPFTYDRALHALTLMRRQGLSLTAAAREAGTTPGTVLRHARPALRRVGQRWVARPRDRLARRVLLYDTHGSYFVTVPTSMAASRIGEYHNAVRAFLQTGEATRLRAFAGRFVVDVEGRRHRFLADPAAIRRLARAGEFRFESIY